MKLIVKIWVLFFCNYLFTSSLHEFSLVFLKNDRARIVQINDLNHQDVNFQINKLPDAFVNVSQEKVANIVALGKKINFIENSKCSLLATQENFQVGIKILDLNGEYFVFLLHDNEVDEVYLISNDIIMNILDPISDPELDHISKAIGNQPIEVVKIPLPPIVTQTLVRILTFFIVSYYHIKDSVNNFLNPKPK